MLTTEVENFPGFPDGVMGPELMMRMREQASRFGADIQTVRASRVDLSSRPFGVWVGDPDAAEPTHRGHTVIVSTGAQSLMLGLPNELELVGHGLSTCATCDGFFFRDHDIAVVGGGDSALEEAMFLTKFARSVTLIHRRDQLRASKIMQERARANEKIRFRWNAQVHSLKGTTKVEGIELRDTVTGEISDLDVTGVFVAIGHRPGTPRPPVPRASWTMEDSGYLVTGPGSATNLEGVFACGDVQDHTYGQAITAAGSGCMAAIDAERWLESSGIHS